MKTLPKYGTSSKVLALARLVEPRRACRKGEQATLRLAVPERAAGLPAFVNAIGPPGDVGVVTGAAGGHHVSEVEAMEAVTDEAG
ncbi:hypothetical protein [Nonomuraea rubra]|uniref:hypothetical protein n=1 Tax=Nonomuraea rubra TaxID=46180 RepID=UPI0031E8E433